MPRKSVQKLIDEGSPALKMALSDMNGEFSPFIIDEATKDPNFYYYWASKDDISNPAHVDKLKRIGYQIVNRDNNSGEVAPFADVQTPDGGAIQTREHVLMRIPMEYHLARGARVSEIGDERLTSYKNEAEEAIGKTDGAMIKNRKPTYSI